MRRLLCLICVLILEWPGLAGADSLTYTVMGTGGLSQPVPGFSDAPFWWADNSGNVPGSTVTAYGFYPLPNIPQALNSGLGSLLLSTPFSLGGGDTVKVDVSVLTTHNRTVLTATAGFAVLLQNSTLRAILADVRPDGVNQLGSLPSPPENHYVQPGPGVTTTAKTGPRSDLVPLALGNTVYGVPIPGDASACFSECYTEVTSSYSPGAGTYQLLFGAYNLFDVTQPSTALAVKSVSVPEPSLLVFLLMGFIGLTVLEFVRRRDGKSTC